MNDREKQLKEIIDKILHMAIRYSHGRHSTSSAMIRDAVETLKNLYPNFKLDRDNTIEPPTKEMLSSYLVSRSDWLDDLFEEK